MSELQDALEVIESTNLKYFTKEMIAEFMALKGSFLAHIGRWGERERENVCVSVRKSMNVGACERKGGASAFGSYIAVQLLPTPI